MKWIFLILVVLLLSGCAQSIAEVKDEEHIGKTVNLRGTVEGTIKIGQLSGFTLNDGDTIRVSSATLPEEGKTITVRGVLIKDSLFGYYIKAEKVY